VRVLHVPFGYFPDPVAGTEQYVAGLAREQQALGIDPVVAAPAAADAEYAHEGVSVHRYAVSATLTLEELWAAGDPGAAHRFGAILDRVRPDVVHLHAYTSGVSLRCAVEARARGTPMVFTYHTPATCPRGTLLRWGRIPCDGLLLDHRCGACMMSAHGVPAPLARLIERPVRMAGRQLDQRHGGVWTGIRMPALVSQRNRAVMEFLGQAARIVVLADWSRQVLERNGVAAERITLVRHGLLEPIPRLPRRPAGPPLRIGYFGRVDPIKGVHLLVEAMRLEPAVQARLLIYGIQQAGRGIGYEAALRKRAGDDPRIEFYPAIDHARLGDALAEIDIVAVPSLVFESGPLIALEAFAAGVPVAGSDLGGIRELVRDGENGLLLDRSVAAWRHALHRLTRDGALLAYLREHIAAPRLMRDAAVEMSAIYDAIRA